MKQSELWDAIVTALHVPGRQKNRPSAARTRARARPPAVAGAIGGRQSGEPGSGRASARTARTFRDRRRKWPQALTALERHKFDLVLMDVQMPEMGGLEATQLIREKEKSTGEHVPIVAMTAHAMQGDRERCIAAGMDGYLSKPIDPKSFPQTVEGISQHLAASQTPATNRRRAKKRGGPERAGCQALLQRFSGNRKLLRRS